jgi:hypothetical protein
MSLVPWIDALHARVRRSQCLFRVVLGTRYLFAMAFIPTGLVKLMGHRFTTISTETPIGAFFEAMYQTGAYWQFLGATQILAGLLLLVPRLATLGAILFFPIVVNIMVITWALKFQGTVYVTTLMVCASASLLAWDWHRLRGILVSTPTLTDQSGWVTGLGPWWERTAWTVGLIAGLLLWFGIRGFAASWLMPTLAIGGICALVAVAGLWNATRMVRSPSRHSTPT